ncbi:MAG TPA: hypothetical protein VJB60_03810 [Candidatus Peribacterales bacterium]|nr:hypothetical protein [Candidatus Peribacterales bacterium]
MLEGKEINVCPMFDGLGISTRGLQPIVQTPGMYPYKEQGDVRKNWSYFMSYGLTALRQDFTQRSVPNPRIMALTGIGNGLEGIAAARIFPDSLRRLHVIDVDQEILRGALHNIRRNVETTHLEIIGHVGSFFEPIEGDGAVIDLAAGNVPNLPSEEDQKLITGSDKGTFMPREWFERYLPPEIFLKWALGTQYAFLMSASKVVRKEGSAMTLVGGRFPLPLAKDLFTQTGYERPEEVICGFKQQTEPTPDYRGYSAFEQASDDVRFDFYLYENAQKRLAQSNIGNPTRIHTGSKIKSTLEDLKVSAQQALEVHSRGTTLFGHTVHLFRGIR